MLTEHFNMDALMQIADVVRIWTGREEEAAIKKLLIEYETEQTEILFRKLENERAERIKTIEDLRNVVLWKQGKVMAYMVRTGERECSEDSCEYIVDDEELFFDFDKAMAHYNSVKDKTTDKIGWTWETSIFEVHEKDCVTDVSEIRSISDISEQIRYNGKEVLINYSSPEIPENTLILTMENRGGGREPHMIEASLPRKFNFWVGSTYLSQQVYLSDLAGWQDRSYTRYHDLINVSDAIEQYGNELFESMNDYDVSKMFREMYGCTEVEIKVARYFKMETELTYAKDDCVDFLKENFTSVNRGELYKEEFEERDNLKLLVYKEYQHEYDDPKWYYCEYNDTYYALLNE
jgi:hypothetical protein